MNRNTAHRHVNIFNFAALGERDVEGSGSVNRVFEKHLVKVAHTIEKQAIRVVFLHLKKLGDHGGNALGVAIRIGGHHVLSVLGHLRQYLI